MYGRVPQRRSCSLPGFRLSDVQWDSLQLPINLAFFYHSEGKAGDRRRRQDHCRLSESGRPDRIAAALDAGQSIVVDNPLLCDLQPEVEALLVNRLWGEHLYYLVGIDECYRLSGPIRLHWRGLSGGGGVWEEVKRYFERLKERSWSN